MLRFLVAVLFVIPFLLFSFILQPIMLLIGVFSRKARDRVSLSIVNWAFRVVIAIAGTKAEVTGLENVPKDEAVLYVINHRSFFDIILTYVRVPRPTGYVAKKELLNYLTLTWWMKLLHCEFLDRKDIRKGMKTINDCAEKIKKGISMVIFPEGTRNKGDEPMLPFHGGSFKIAEKTDCKIIPVVLTNTSAIFEDHLPWLRSKKVTIDYLPPVDTAKMDREERKQLPEHVRQLMVDAYVKRMKEK